LIDSWESELDFLFTTKAVATYIYTYKIYTLNKWNTVFACVPVVVVVQRRG
jgi:hypothetical protein